MKESQWPGLVTNASPFVIPPTAGVEQLNLTSSVPGQVAVRGGMRKVASTVASLPILECYPYVSKKGAMLIAMAPDGALVALPSPARGPATPPAAEPTLSRPGAKVTVSYTYRYVEGATDSAPPPPPPPGGCSSTLDGGDAYTSSHAYTLDAESCSKPTALSADGGTAASTAPCDSDALPVLCGTLALAMASGTGHELTA